MAKQVQLLPGMRDVSLFGETKFLPLDTAITTNHVDVVLAGIGYARGRSHTFGYTVRISFVCSHVNTGKLAFLKAFRVEMPCNAEAITINDYEERQRVLIRQEAGYLRPIVAALEQQLLLDFKRGYVALDALMQAFRLERRRAAGATRLRVNPV